MSHTFAINVMNIELRSLFRSDFDFDDSEMMPMIYSDDFSC